MLRPATREFLITRCDQIFSVSLIAFTFVMFSCLFPTGYSATFSTIAFCAAVVNLSRYSAWPRFSKFEVIGIGLFLWLTLSILWSQSSIYESLIALFEYRLFVMIPIFAFTLRRMPKTQEYVVFAVTTGSAIALIASYGLASSWWKFAGAHLSLANHIYHGFIMSIFLIISMVLAREAKGLGLFFWILVSSAIVFNVLNIEVGRSGFLQVISVLVCFGLSIAGRRNFLSVVALILTIGTITYVALPSFNAVIVRTVVDLLAAISDSQIETSTGHRFEYYRMAVQMIMERPLLGWGVGDVASELRARFDSGQMLLLTDNVHSEFLNMLLIGGLPAGLLFAFFIFSIFVRGLALLSCNKLWGSVFLCISTLIFVSAIFNSIIKDYGEKHVLLIVLSWLAAKQLNPEESDKNRA